MKQLQTTILNTDRLLLREANPAVYDFVFKEYNNYELMMFFGFNSAEELLQEKSRFENGITTFNKSVLYFHLIDKISSMVIGMCGYHTWYLQHARAELFYVLYDDSWKRKGNYNLGFFVGNNTSTLSFGKGNDPLYRSFDKFSFNSSTNLSFGISSIIKFRNPISLLSIQNELVYSNGSFSAEYFDQSDVGGGVTAKETIKTDVNYKLLTYRVGPRISIRSNSINPYVAFGFSIPIMKTVGIKSIRTTQINNATPEVQELKPIASLPNFWLSIGVKKKIASDYALYFELTNDLKGGDTGTGQVSGLTSKIGFLF